jgi:hypothetical protein
MTEKEYLAKLREMNRSEKRQEKELRSVWWEYYIRQRDSQLEELAIQMEMNRDRLSKFYYAQEEANKKSKVP